MTHRAMDQAVTDAARPAAVAVRRSAIRAEEEGVEPLFLVDAVAACAHLLSTGFDQSVAVSQAEDEQDESALRRLRVVKVRGVDRAEYLSAAVSTSILDDDGLELVQACRVAARAHDHFVCEAMAGRSRRRSLRAAQDAANPLLDMDLRADQRLRFRREGQRLANTAILLRGAVGGYVGSGGRAGGDYLRGTIAQVARRGRGCLLDIKADRTGAVSEEELRLAVMDLLNAGRWANAVIFSYE